MWAVLGAYSTAVQGSAGGNRGGARLGSALVQTAPRVRSATAVAASCLLPGEFVYIKFTKQTLLPVFLKGEVQESKGTTWNSYGAIGD